MLVVDTSAVVAALVAQPPNAPLVARLSEDGDIHAPHLLDVEVIHTFRRLVRLRELSLEQAEDARADLADWTIVRYPHVGIADRMWELRDNLTAYDAAYVALAEVLDVPLVTLDGRIARAPGHRAQVEVY